VKYLVANEWAQTAEDILWRRTKSGLHMNAAQREAFAQFMGR
jgi:glycerol-3-phosphate dehydrogenase